MLVLILVIIPLPPFLERVYPYTPIYVFVKLFLWIHENPKLFVLKRRLFRYTFVICRQVLLTFPSKISNLLSGYKLSNQPFLSNFNPLKLE
jgi:hypothetical protein